MSEVHRHVSGFLGGTGRKGSGDVLLPTIHSYGSLRFTLSAGMKYWHYHCSFPSVRLLIPKDSMYMNR